MTENALLPVQAFQSETHSRDTALSYAREGIKYAGSKLKLLEAILAITEKIERNTVLDMFSGTTRVGRLFFGLGSQVHSNDISYWSQCFGKAYFYNQHNQDYYEGLIEHLNNIKPVHGWFTENYGGADNSGSAVQANGKKALWQLHNTELLDGIRTEIDKLNLDEVSKAVALTSLIYALDSVDSTLGHFAAYLKHWSPRSYKTMNLKVPHVRPTTREHFVSRMDANDLANQLANAGKIYDLAYLDPPYGSNNEKMPPSRVRYASYYHIWTTIIRNDQPDLFGAAGRRVDSRDLMSASQYEEFRRNDNGTFIALEALKHLIQTVPARHVLLSYSSGGRATFEQLSEILSQTGDIVKVMKIDYKKNVMATMRWTNEWTPAEEKKNFEYLFLVKKPVV
ncbi:DNA adenine methylase [uncultured Mobiluncus sp.]|uniref:DNA adenine methylase n=1 Tax=uncultured Mobiluncus sp. TaxID=293425 RepID=UPI002625DFD6|nr:DNA adenine methylase [uncultured Mobiluncus sp.]